MPLTVFLSWGLTLAVKPVIAVKIGIYLEGRLGSREGGGLGGLTLVSGIRWCRRDGLIKAMSGI